MSCKSGHFSWNRSTENNVIQFSSCLNKLLQVYYSGIIYSMGQKRNDNEAEARNNEIEHTYVPP